MILLNVYLFMTEGIVAITVQFRGVLRCKRTRDKLMTN